MTDDNAYRPPKADLETPRRMEATLREPRRCPPSAGSYWIKDAWQLFKLNPSLLIGMWVVFFLIIAVLSLLPLISILTAIVTPVFTAGFAFVAVKLEHGKIAGIEDLFIGFSRNSSALLGIGSLSFVFSVGALIVAVLLTIFFMGIDTVREILSGYTGEELIRGNPLNEQFNTFILLTIFIYLALQVPLLMLTWFAPVLIIQHDINIWQAMMLSFNGCLRNMIPFLIFGLILTGLFIIAVIPLFLGLLIVAPLFMLTFYTAYKDIFLHAEQYEASLIA